MTKPFLILSNMYPTEKTPSQGVFVRNIEQSLIQSGIDVERVVLSGRQDHLVSKALHYLAYIIRAFFVLLSTDRVVYLHYVAHSSIPFLAAAKFRKLKLIAHVHGGDVLPAMYEPEKVRKVKIWLAKKTLSKAEKIIVPSTWFARFLSKEFGLPECVIEVNPSGGVDTNRFSHAGKPSPVFPHEGKLRLGYVGRLDSSKGVDTLLNALKIVDLDFHCDIVGTGLLHQEFELLAKDNGIAEKVTFHGGKAQEYLADFYRSFDYLVFPSEMQESLGLVGLEAMACGTPVIGTMNAGMADYLKHEHNGFGFTSGNADALAQVLQKAAAIEGQSYLELSSRARETALEFDSRVSNQHLLQILK